jgi:hypothetical protein
MLTGFIKCKDTMMGILLPNGANKSNTEDEWQ